MSVLIEWACRHPYGASQKVLPTFFHHKAKDMLPLPASVPSAPALQALFKFFFDLPLFSGFMNSERKIEFIKYGPHLCEVAISEKMELIPLVFPLEI